MIVLTCPGRGGPNWWCECRNRPDMSRCSRVAAHLARSSSMEEVAMQCTWEDACHGGMAPPVA
jgi:hypothetical protein